MNVHKNFVQYLASCKSVETITKKDNSLYFKRNGITYVFEISNGDDEFFKIVIPNIDDYTQEKAVRFANFFGKYKVVKPMVVNNQICISADQFVYGQMTEASWLLLFDRIVDLLKYVLDEYRQEFQK